MSWLLAIASLLALALVLWALLVAVLWVHRPTRDVAAAAAWLLPDLLRLVRSLLSDPATPRSVKLALGGLALWIASPIDLIPEFIPVIGPLDDLVVAAIVLRWAGHRVGRDEIRRHWTGRPESLGLLERML
jgi:uncharacterized membrane protein YkvA (DUF1232 family)